MRIAFFNCFAGTAGDMTLGALLDAGLDIEHLQNELKKLNVSGYHLHAEKTQRHGISATKFNVLIEDEHGVRHADHPHAHHDEHSHDHKHEHSHDHKHEHSHDHKHEHSHDHKHEHSHDHKHEHPHEHEHEHSHDHKHGHEHGHSHAGGHTHRSFSDIRNLINASELSDRVKEKSIAIFSRLAQAEGKMHDKPPEEVHFHEVGSVDAIIDIVGTCIGLEALGIEKVYASAIRVGTGQVKAAHGVLPVPAPATMELLRGVPVQHTEIPFEMTTPTGAAIIAELAESFGAPQLLVPETIGYGAGNRDTHHIANLLRVEIGTTVAEEGTEEEVVMLETTIDDMTTEIYGYVIEQLMEAGAKDVFLTQVLMKKNRPGIVLSVLTEACGKNDLLDIIFRETPTLGVRVTPVLRKVLPREAGTVETRWGDVRVKHSTWNGETRTKPEYEDCAELARRHGVPIREIYGEVLRTL